MSEAPGHYTLHMQFHREGDQWVGLCAELGTSGFGATREEAEDVLVDLMGLHLDTLEAVGNPYRGGGRHGR